MQHTSILQLARGRAAHVQSDLPPALPPALPQAQPKRLGTQVLSGPMLAGLAEAYVDAINHGAVPTIATAWQARARQPARGCECGSLLL